MVPLGGVGVLLSKGKDCLSKAQKPSGYLPFGSVWAWAWYQETEYRLWKQCYTLLSDDSQFVTHFTLVFRYSKLDSVRGIYLNSMSGH